MPHVSRFPLDKITEEKLQETLELVFSRISKEAEVKEFLLAFLTKTERLMLAKRLAVIILLKEGLPESHIANALHVTRITVSRMQLFLEARGKGYEIALQKLENEKIMQDVKLVLRSLAKQLVRNASGRI